jgi:hypothetical protein
MSKYRIIESGCEYLILQRRWFFLWWETIGLGERSELEMWIKENTQ